MAEAVVSRFGSSIFISAASDSALRGVAAAERIAEVLQFLRAGAGVAEVRDSAAAADAHRFVALRQLDIFGAACRAERRIAPFDPVDLVEDQRGGFANLRRKRSAVDDRLRRADGVGETAAREVEMRGDHVELAQPFVVAGAAIEMPQPMQALRCVRPLAVVGGEVGEDEEDAAAGAVALRLLDQRQRAQRLVARRGPRAGGEEDVDAVERGVDPLGLAARAVERVARRVARRVEIVRARRDRSPAARRDSASLGG